MDLSMRLWIKVNLCFFSDVPYFIPRCVVTPLIYSLDWSYVLYNHLLFSRAVIFVLQVLDKYFA